MGVVGKGEVRKQQERDMACPTVRLTNRTLIILNGFSESRNLAQATVQGPLAWQDIPAAEKLRQAAQMNPDAVAFGYTCGHWVPAA
jgi:hypothetical protein